MSIQRVAEAVQSPHISLTSAFYPECLHLPLQRYVCRNQETKIGALHSRHVYSGFSIHFSINILFLFQYPIQKYHATFSFIFLVSPALTVAPSPPLFFPTTLAVLRSPDQVFLNVFQSGSV